MSLRSTEALSAHPSKNQTRDAEAVDFRDHHRGDDTGE